MSVKSWAPSMGNGFQVAKFLFEVQKASSLFCCVQNGPEVIWVACIGLRGSSKLSLRSARAFSEAFWTFSPKGLEKYLALLQDNLEIPLRLIRATQMTAGPFWTRQKMLEAIGTSNRNLAT